MVKLTPQESECLHALATAWKIYLELPVVHQWHRAEYMHAIHAAQCIVLARPAMRGQEGSDKQEVDRLMEYLE